MKRIIGAGIIFAGILRFIFDKFMFERLNGLAHSARWRDFIPTSFSLLHY